MLPPRDAKVAIAMSGGVDSAVAAAMMVEMGYSCVGLTLRLVPEPSKASVFEPCCGLQASEDARRICEKLGIPHRVIYAVDRFDRDIISFFVEEYTAGRTPNPCIRCNRMIKFGALYRYMRELGADYVVMGHYARLERRGDRYGLRRAVYRDKDQSYVLAPLTQAQLSRAVFPLGDFTKDEVRAKARALDIRVAAKPDSQELCFVPDRDYASFVEARNPEASQPGPIYFVDGTLVGFHRGLHRYTIGQRRGLGLSAPRPYYVVALDPRRNALIVGYEEHTSAGSVFIGPLSWGAMPPAEEPFRAWVQLRSRHQAAPCRVIPTRRHAWVHFDQPERAATPGQWAVLYDAEGFVLASGEIQEVASRHALERNEAVLS